jgi:polyphosphate kinase
MNTNAVPDPQNVFNRHLSWLQFNERVLEEARDETNPVLERVKFLAITASNLDEFVEVRVAGLLQQVSMEFVSPARTEKFLKQCCKSSSQKFTSSSAGNTNAGATCWCPRSRENPFGC